MNFSCFHDRCWRSMATVSNDIEASSIRASNCSRCSRRAQDEAAAQSTRCDAPQRYIAQHGPKRRDTDASWVLGVESVKTPTLWDVDQGRLMGFLASTSTRARARLLRVIGALSPAPPRRL
eukprot:Polyplicarium_translucidae@DN1662_c0_g1_i1.p4